MDTQPTIESLEAKIQELSISIEYIDVANALSYELFLKHRDTERAHGLATETYGLCTTQFSDYQKGLADALINLAFFQTVKPDMQEALHLILQAGIVADEIEIADVSYRQLRILRFVYVLMDDFNSAIEVNIDRVKLAQKHNNQKEELTALEALVYDCFRVNEYAQALAYSDKALELAKRLDDKPLLAHVHMNRTYSLRKLNLHDQALDHARQAYCFYKGQQSRLESITLGIFGYIHLELEDYEKAMAYFQQELAIVEVLESDYLKAYSHCEIGMAHLAMGHAHEAIRWLESGLKLAESCDSKSTLIDNYPYLIQAHKANQDYEEALKIFEKLADLRAEVNDTRAINHRNRLLVIHETEQAQLEAQLQQERANRLRIEADNLAQQNALFQKINILKDELVATASHDMRNPLTAMNMELGMLQRLTLDNPQAQRYVNRLQKNVTHVTHLIEDLLDFSDIQSKLRPRFVSTDLTALVTEALIRQESGCRAKQIDLQADLPPDPIHLPLDAHQFERVLDNLIGNAVKYTGEGGEVRVSLAVEDGHAVFRVCDTGRGIPADEIPHIFDSRFRASNSGTELGDGHGLAIVQSIIEAHQGTITCESVLGEGTAFIIHLPFPSLS